MLDDATGSNMYVLVWVIGKQHYLFKIFLVHML